MTNVVVLPRKSLFVVLSVLLSIILTSLAGEFMVRVVVGVPLAEVRPLLRIQANRYTGWSMVRGESHHTYTYPVHINALGLRGPEIGPKREGEIRIFALGDSLVYGQGVSDEETIPYHLQQILSTSHGAQEGTVTVINGGVRGFATNQELGELQEQVAVVRPDIVLLFWYSNDLIEPPIPLVYQRLKNSGPLFFDTRSRLEGTDLWDWRFRQVVRHSALIMWLHDMLRFYNGGPQTSPEDLEKGFVQLDQHLTQFQSMAKTYNFRFFLAIVPDPNSLRGSHESDSYRHRVAGLAEQHQMASVDLIEAVRRADTDSWRVPVIPYDGHFNGEANREMAAEVARLLRNQRLDN